MIDTTEKQNQITTSEENKNFEITRAGKERDKSGQMRERRCDRTREEKKKSKGNGWAGQGERGSNTRWVFIAHTHTRASEAEISSCLSFYGHFPLESNRDSLTLNGESNHSALYFHRATGLVQDPRIWQNNSLHLPFISNFQLTSGVHPHRPPPTHHSLM